MEEEEGERTGHLVGIKVHHCFIHSYSAPRAKSPRKVRRHEWKKVSCEKESLQREERGERDRERVSTVAVRLDDAGFTSRAPLSVSRLRPQTAVHRRG